MNLNSLSTQGTVLTTLEDSTFVVSDVTKIRVVFTNPGDTTHVYTCDIPVTSYGSILTVSGTSAFVAATDGSLITLEAALTNTGTSVTVTLTPTSIPASSTLALRHVLLMFD